MTRTSSDIEGRDIKVDDKRKRYDVSMILPVAAALLLLATPLERPEVVIRHETEAVAYPQNPQYTPQMAAEMRISAGGEVTLTDIDALTALAAAAPPQGNACARVSIEVRGLTFRFNPEPWTDREFREVLDLLWLIHRFAGEAFPGDYHAQFMCTPEQLNELTAFRCGTNG